LSIKSELLAMVEQAHRRFTLPVVREIYLPEPEPAPDKDAEFGMVVLADGSAGLYYAWLGDSQRGMKERFSIPELTGSNAMDLARFYNSDREDDCSLGLATINAITQYVYRQNGYIPGPATDSFGGLALQRTDHPGMVGYFPSLVKKFRKQGIPLTVIEKKPRFLIKDELVQVTLDPAQLRSCNKILITAATMLNNTLEEVLEYTKHAERITVLGPTAGFFPDPLFRRGVTALGGTEIIDAMTAIGRLRDKQPLGEMARKVLVTRDNYPVIRQ
jgi:uncharacterized protein (DUF4213/DUF364 family)